MFFQESWLCCAVLCCVVLCCAVLCYAVLCCVVLCCVVLCRIVLCCVVLLCCTDPNDGEIVGNRTEAFCGLEPEARQALQTLDINACSVAVLSAFMLQAMLCSNGGVALKTIGNASSLK
mgnify:FL=1